MQSSRNVVRGAVAIGALVLVALVGGCSGAGSKHEAIKNNMSPELLSAHQRPVDVDDMTAFTWHTNNRFIWNDLARAAYTDRPSRLEPFPVPR